MKPSATAINPADICFTPDAHATIAAASLDDWMARAGWDPSNTLIVEPSAGAGALRDAVLKQRSRARILAFDIQPAARGIKRADFLNRKRVGRLLRDERKRKPFGHTAVIMNPPFGERCDLALPHLIRALEYAEIVVAILPRTARKEWFERKMPEGVRLYVSKVLNADDDYTRDGKSVEVHCCVQVWVRPPFRRWHAPYRDLRRRDVAPSPEDLGLRVETIQRDADGWIAPSVTPGQHSVTILAQAFESDHRKTSGGIVDKAIEVASGTKAARWTGKRRALAALRAIDWTAVADARSTTPSLSLDRATVCREVTEHLEKERSSRRRRLAPRRRATLARRGLAHSRIRRMGGSTTTATGESA